MALGNCIHVFRPYFGHPKKEYSQQFHHDLLQRNVHARRVNKRIFAISIGSLRYLGVYLYSTLTLLQCQTVKTGVKRCIKTTAKRS